MVTPVSPPAIDLAQLARYTGGDSGIDAEVLELFGQQTVAAVERLATLLAARDQKAWRETAHGLKGAALAVGASDIAGAAAHVERLDPANDPVMATDGLETLDRCARAAAQFIEAWLAARRPAGTR